MPSNLFRIVFIGDIVGKYGRRLLGKALPLVRIKYGPDLVIANGENAAGGLGITPPTALEIFDCGVDIITGGNHIWDKKDALQLIKDDDRIVRPINFPPNNPGKGYTVFTDRNHKEVLIVSLQGRVFMDPVVDNPFLAMDTFLKDKKYKMIFVDFHAEATAEKQAMGFYLDGRVSAVIGTHTHVQTNDLRILENGTAYQSDVGMTGAMDSVIGMKREAVIQKFVTGINHRFEVSKNTLVMDLAILDIDKDSGKAVNLESLRIHESRYEEQLKF
ncbi:MAG: TIGR00282 family metallophosphoesterase [bacterium]|nr:TIGR00282 family metallophosphoesterase [bacterium]